MTDEMSVIFGSIGDENVTEYYLDNGHIRCSVLDYGCILRTLMVLDKCGNMMDVVLGYCDLEHYTGLSGRMGAVIGRYANRVRNGRFSIDGTEYRLSMNRGKHHIHGGFNGFDKKIWEVLEHDSIHILLCCDSADGEEGYPGNIRTTVEYRLSDCSLTIEYSAISDNDTICNLTNHSYFNLTGNGTINNHNVQIRSNEYIPTDSEGIPVGGIEALPDSMRVDQVFTIEDKCFDTDLILYSESNSAVVSSDSSGIVMRIATDMPAIRFYTGDGLKETEGKNGPIGPRSGMCFETQFPVDSPNYSKFKGCILRKGQRYQHKTKFTFSLL
jgi:aldose 1-epimerase